MRYIVMEVNIKIKKIEFTQFGSENGHEKCAILLVFPKKSVSL